MLFVADVMLKKLARWLRIIGVPTVFAGDYTEDDDEIIKLAMAKEAVLLTRDKALARKAGDYVPVVLLSSTVFEKQLLQLAKEKRIQLAGFESRTLCPQCGNELRVVGREKVRGKVFPRVYAAHEKFWLCSDTKCGKIYWTGSHWLKIGGTVEKVAGLLKGVKKAAGRKKAI
jgi:hypothetical protein